MQSYIRQEAEAISLKAKYLVTLSLKGCGAKPINLQHDGIVVSCGKLPINSMRDLLEIYSSNEHATGYMLEDNVSVYSARFYEGRHVIGKIAGRVTESNVIGYIASFPIPEVIRGINSAFLAAKSVNPDVQIKIVWVYSWYDPGKEADAANALIAQGADVLMQHTDSTAAMTVAEEKVVFKLPKELN